MTPPGRSEGELAVWAPVEREVRTGTWHQQAEPTADRIEAAVRRVLRDGLRTGDIALPGEATIGTRAMGDAVVVAMRGS